MVLLSKKDSPTFDTAPPKYNADAEDEVIVRAERIVTAMGDGLPVKLDAK